MSMNTTAVASRGTKRAAISLSPGHDLSECVNNLLTVIVLTESTLLQDSILCTPHSLTAKRESDNNVDPSCNYMGLLHKVETMPQPGTPKHNSIYCYVMADYFYEFMRLEGVFTQEQIDIIDGETNDNRKLCLKVCQIFGQDIPDS